MADRATLEKARRELEEMYLGIPDESVNLTFGDLAEVKQHAAPGPSEKRKSGPLEPITEVTKPNKEQASALAKLPSLDFSRALEATAHRHHRAAEDLPYRHAADDRPYHHVIDDHRHHRAAGDHQNHHVDHHQNHHGGAYNSKAYDDMSGMSMGASSMNMSTFQEGGGRRRPGIPHSNICTICSNYIYMCRHRCLVCGRAYCRQCVGMGMGGMSEGRKCVECLGRRFSQRYIQRAGQVSCCVRFRYSSEVMQQELKWAEKGPRKNPERRYGQSGMKSTSRSPVTPRTPTRAHASPSPPSFVMNSPYSAYSPTNHPLPF